MLIKFYTSSILFIVTTMSLLPMYVFAMEQQLSNAGFVSQNIWYSEQKFFAGDKVVIHAIITSGGEYDFSGIVKFYDGRNLIGVKDFLVKSGDYVKDAQIDWIATEGNHKINAQISDSKIIIDGNEVPIDVSNSEAVGADSFVDLDTDGDRIGNREDLDDDGDGISDEEELRMGTDPLKKDLNSAVNTAGNRANEENNGTSGVPNGLSLNNIIKNAGDVAEGSVLPIAKSATKKVFEVTEVARNIQKKFADEKILKVRENIIKEKEKKKRGIAEKGFSARTPFNYTSLLALTFLSYTAKYALLYYGLVGIAIVYFLIILWRRWRGRGH